MLGLLLIASDGFDLYQIFEKLLNKSTTGNADLKNFFNHDNCSAVQAKIILVEWLHPEVRWKNFSSLTLYNPPFSVSDSNDQSDSQNVSSEHDIPQCQKKKTVP